jgi:uncharacterized protein
MNKGTSEPDFKKYFDRYAPGVYREKGFQRPRRVEFDTGVPAFLGLIPSAKARPNSPNMLTNWSQFEDYVGANAPPDCYLAYAVRGFFENGGWRCYVVVLKDETAQSLEEGLAAIAELNTIDLVCAPDLVRQRQTTFGLQQLVVQHCGRMGDRFAVLDTRLGDGTDEVWSQWSEIDGYNGAIYYPWVKVQSLRSGAVFVPPCGHIAGVYARTDHTRGVHKAPANEVLEGVLDLERHLTNIQHGELNQKRINCLRAFPGRGIRVWGARTLSGQDLWTYVSVRRLFLTAIRWIEWHMEDTVFEPNDSKLWAAIERELNSYFYGQFRRGALKGNTPEEAFYVKCNEETNPEDVRERNEVVAEIGLAPNNPYEFVVVRLIQGAGGVRISGASRPH